MTARQTYKDRQTERLRERERLRDSIVSELRDPETQERVRHRDR